jgi:hypothetical protein
VRHGPGRGRGGAEAFPGGPESGPALHVGVGGRARGQVPQPLPCHLPAASQALLHPVPSANALRGGADARGAGRRGAFGVLPGRRGRRDAAGHVLRELLEPGRPAFLRGRGAGPARGHPGAPYADHAGGGEREPAALPPLYGRPPLLGSARAVPHRRRFHRGLGALQREPRLRARLLQGPLPARRPAQRRNVPRLP